MKLKALIIFIFSYQIIMAQMGSVNISVYDAFTKAPISALVEVDKTAIQKQGLGYIQIDSLSTGTYSFKIEAKDYVTGWIYDIDIIPNQNISLSLGLDKISNENEIETITLTKNTYKKTEESPVSLRTLSAEEIQKSAGANRDISKAIQGLPGVGSSINFRNDLLIRGGSSMENKFYVDGIEMPTINHFQTQGTSGGPRGIITIDFIKEVDFFSSAFPAHKNGMLSSLFEFHLKSARKDKIGYKGVLGLDDMQLMADGPLSKKYNWSGLFSIRKSNLQLLFKAIGLPFLPSYYDTNFKISKKFHSGDELYFIGIGAIDHFKFNENTKPTRYNLSIVENLPINNQWNYTIGAGYKHLRDNGHWLFTLSRSELNNRTYKYFKNIESIDNLLLDYSSKEEENKARADFHFRLGEIKLSTGGNFSLSRYFNDSFAKIFTTSGDVQDQYSTDILVSNYGYYLQGSYKTNRWSLSLGARIDGSDYSTNTNSPLEQFSPRISFSYALNQKKNLFLNLNAGIYYQLPPYTFLGYQKNDVFINKETLKYIENRQLVAGLEYRGNNNLRITLESYYKKYKNIPFSIRNGVSLANISNNLSALGAEPLDARGFGETYGVELLAQKRTINNLYGILAYTFGYSKFSDANAQLLPSSWDTRHIFSLTLGKYFNRNWNVGLRFRYQSALPETPYDLAKSQKVSVWNITNSPIRNLQLLNTLRGNGVGQLDIRIEKKWILKSWQISGYLDLVNILTSPHPSALPVISLERNADSSPIITNPTSSYTDQTYLLNQSPQERSRFLPYLGVIVEF